MAGYSQTPVARKLGIKAGSCVALMDAPVGFVALLSPLPDEVDLRTAIALEGDLDVIISFFHDRATLDERFLALAKCLASNGGLWTCWPKKASGVVTDLSDNVVRAIGLDAGLVDNKVCAIDDTWSALRFVRRLSDRGARR